MCETKFLNQCILGLVTSGWASPSGLGFIFTTLEQRGLKLVWPLPGQPSSQPNAMGTLAPPATTTTPTTPAVWVTPRPAPPRLRATPPGPTGDSESGGGGGGG